MNFKVIFFVIIIFVFLFYSCRFSNDDSKMDFICFDTMEEILLTNGEKGHFLNNNQYFSSDDNWIVYDTRNDGSQIGRTCCVEAVNIETKEIKKVYSTKNQTSFGPGVGAVTISPTENKVLFIQGLQNCDASKPYDITRRSGVVVDLDNPAEYVFLDARCITPPFTSGALRGGTHAHSWSSDGKWICFTYNDAILQQLEKDGVPGKKDLRMVGIMAPYGPVKVAVDDSGENNNGSMFTVVVTKVTENPVPGSDQIDRAYEEGWVGDNGYIKENGERQKRAVAFLGDLYDKMGNKFTEVFIADIPDDVSNEYSDQPLVGDKLTRPNPPKGVQQRRLTYTADRMHPGVQGPRHWLRTSPDGHQIFFLMRDEGGVIQIHGVTPLGGVIKQITFNDFSVETTFSISPDGEFVAYGSNQNVYVTKINSGETKMVSPELEEELSGLQSVYWSNNGKMLAYNRKVRAGDSSFYQIFILK